ncbi:hypothetical protein D3C74_344640 [compost metagenome]
MGGNAAFARFLLQQPVHRLFIRRSFPFNHSYLPFVLGVHPQLARPPLHFMPGRQRGRQQLINEVAAQLELRILGYFFPHQLQGEHQPGLLNPDLLHIIQLFFIHQQPRYCPPVDMDVPAQRLHRLRPVELGRRRNDDVPLRINQSDGRF